MQNIKDKTSIIINDQKMSSNKGEIAVYIAGEVVKPGVYYIAEDSRVVDLLELCGGLTDEADLTDVNLAEKLEDSDKIEIPSKKENIDMSNYMSEYDYENNEKSGLVNINKATKEELKSLNGIGDTLAQNIIEYRKNNKFESIEDILNVNGIGDAKFEQIKEYICVD